MKIHIFSSENLYTFSYLKFLERNFDISADWIVFKKYSGANFAYSELLRKRIKYFKSNLRLFSCFLHELKKSSKIILHQLPHGPALIFWRISPRLLAKTTWVIWGGDVYLHRQAGNNFSGRLYEYFRKKIIANIPRIASFIPGDFNLVRKIYGSKATWLQSAYPLPVDFLSYQPAEKRVTAGSGLKILAGNSGNPSNHHHEILAKLEPLKGKDIKIFCPLSYSGNPAYIETVMKTGEEIFGGKFIPITELLTPDNYLDLLADIDIVFMNHERQQGLGNILPLLYFGKKVYIRSDTTTFNYLTETGCRIYDISSFNALDDSIFRPDNESPERNRRIIGELLSEKNCRTLWDSILNQ